MKLTQEETQKIQANLVSYIMEFEGGGDDSITEEDLLKFFQYLVNTGQAWTLQGVYGRTAHALIEAGKIDPAN